MQLSKNHQEIAWSATFAIVRQCLDYTSTMGIDFKQHSEEIEPIVYEMIKGAWDAVLFDHSTHKGEE